MVTEPYPHKYLNLQAASVIAIQNYYAVETHNLCIY